MSEEYTESLHGYSKKWHQIKQSQKYWKQTWIDNIGSILEQRDLKLCQRPKKNTVNKTLIDYVNDYIINKKLLQSINCIWLYKGVYLPFELVGERGGMMIDACINMLE